jgi:type IV pilus assembly protein PilO
MEISPGVQTRLDQIAKLPLVARIGIILVIALLVAGGYYFGFYQDKAEKLERLRTQDLELQRKLSEVRSVAANLAEFEQEITNLELKLASVLRQLPNRKELEVLLTDISNLGKTAGIEIKSFVRKDELVHGFYAEVPIEIEIAGEFHDVARFFDLIARLPRIVNMGALTMKVERETLEATRLRINGTAITFRFVSQDEEA